MTGEDFGTLQKSARQSAEGQTAGKRDTYI